MMPVLYLTNFASRKLHHGHVYTIMARPRAWEHGEGTVSRLVPSVLDLTAYQHGHLSIEEYRRKFENHIMMREWRDLLRPGRLCTEEGVVIADGDTLCCSCSKAEAVAGRCHRAWAAPYLVSAGWTVILDGVEVKE